VIETARNRASVIRDIRMYPILCLLATTEKHPDAQQEFGTLAGIHATLHEMNATLNRVDGALQRMDATVQNHRIIAGNSRIRAPTAYAPLQKSVS
jgi:hypothetical protein